MTGTRLAALGPPVIAPGFVRDGRRVSQGPSPAMLGALLTSGGDERIAVDPVTGRNRYGTPADCAEDEVWFASSTASAISPRGHAAAAAAGRALLGGDPSLHIPSWFARLRSRLADLFCPPGSQVILAGSGTDAELIVVSLAHALFGRPCDNLIVASGETGSGVPLAAAGRHFLVTAPHGEGFARGERLAGLEAFDLAVRDIAIRSATGHLRAADEVDHDGVAAAEAALRGGRAVVAHVLDASKTGQSGLRRSTAATLLARAPDRVLIAVDACQLRCPAEQIRRDLQAGFVVIITGSKFAGGPPFAGAVLVPPALSGRLDGLRLPAGLGVYSARQDWPASLLGRTRNVFGTSANFGLGLRWEAALAEMEPYFAIDAALRRRIIGAFGTRVRAAVHARAGLTLLDAPAHDADDEATIFPVATSAPDGRAIAAQAVQTALRARSQGSHDRVFHVGQPVAVGSVDALRICLSMPQVVDVADRLRHTGNVDQAIRQLADDLDGLVDKWTAIRAASARV